MLRRHAAAAPRLCSARACDQLDLKMVRISESQHLLLKSRKRSIEGDLARRQAIHPELQAGDGNREGNQRRLTRPQPPPRRTWPWKKRKDRSGTAVLVAVVEMIR